MGFVNLVVMVFLLCRSWSVDHNYSVIEPIQLICYKKQGKNNNLARHKSAGLFQSVKNIIVSGFIIVVSSEVLN